VTVLPSMNAPRLPGLKQILAASKKPVQNLTVTDLGLSGEDLVPRLRRVEMLGASSTRRNVKLTGSAGEVVAQLLQVLKQEELI